MDRKERKSERESNMSFLIKYTTTSLSKVNNRNDLKEKSV